MRMPARLAALAAGFVCAACPLTDTIRDARIESATWTEPADPVRIIDSIYFVGTRGLGVYLISTSDGLILLNGAVGKAAQLVDSSIASIGHRADRIRLILSNHAHFDHVGTHAHFKNLTRGTDGRPRAKVLATSQDADLLESGGRKDFQYGTLRPFRFDRVDVDSIVRDGDTVRLGGVSLVARHTPGHTKGGTTWIMTANEAGRQYTVVFPEGTSINPGYRLVRSPSYDGIARDYQRSFRILDSLAPDIWLAAHTSFFNFERKRDSAAVLGARAWADSAGFRAFVRSARARFDSIVDHERRQ